MYYAFQSVTVQDAMLHTKKKRRRLKLERLESRALLAAGMNVALYEFTTHDPSNGVLHLFSSDTHASTTASDITSNLYLGFTGNGDPPRGLALGGAFDETSEPTPAGGQNDYFEFTITPDAGFELSLSRFAMQVRKNDPNSKDSYSVYFDNDPGAGGDNFTTKILSQTIFSEDVFETLDVDLESIAMLANQTTPITFRVYSWGTVGLGTARLDNIRVQAVSETTSGSIYAYYGDSERLINPLDELGNRVADFSTAGYKYGNSPIPDVAQSITAARVVNVSPIAGDNTAHIQAAIDQVEAMSLDANGFRGIVQLHAGDFPINDQVNILGSGVVLRGVGDGDDPLVDTILRGTGTTKRSLVVVGPSAGFASGIGSTTHNIVDKYVPVGATSLNVDSTTNWSVGDPIVVRRPSTADWIADIGMDSIPPRSDGGTVNQWAPGSYDQLYERVITRIEGDRVFFNAPLMNAFELQYGGGTIFRYTFPRINNVGIENIRGKSDFVGPEDEDHANTFIELQAVEDAWVSNVTGQHFVYATVHATSRSIRVTVDDARSLDPVSIVTGGRRYPFNVDGQFVLMKNLYSEFGRHDFVNNSTIRNRGPNVFLDAVAVNSLSATGPHQRWSTGTLYDTVKTENLIEARNRGNFGTGHGWGGANFVFWNTVADTNIIQNPPTAQNWLIGAIGSVIEETRFGPQPSGNYDSIGSPIDFGDANNPTSSLFVAQYNQRTALGNGLPPTQLREYVLGDYDNAQSDGAASADAVFIDPAWQAEIAALAIGATLSDTDTSIANQYVPLSFQYGLDTGEEVYAAVLTLGLRATAGDPSDDVLMFDSVGDSRSFMSLGVASTLAANETTPVTIEIFGADLIALQDGLLNLAVSNNTLVDWGTLELQVADNLAPVVTIVDSVHLGASAWPGYVASHIDPTGSRGFDITAHDVDSDTLSSEVLDTFFIQFDEGDGATLQQSDFDLSGVNLASYADRITSFAYNETTQVATLGLNQPLGLDRYRLSVTGGYVLDFSVFPGDLDGNGVINEGELSVYDAAYFTEPGDANFENRADVNGDGLVTIGDLQSFSDNFALGLPSGTAGLSGLVTSSTQVVTQDSQQMLIVDGFAFDPQPIGQTLSVSGTQFDDMIQLADSSLLNISVDGGSGVDRLTPLVNNQTIDLPARLQNGTLRSIEIVDLSGMGANELIVSADAIRAMSPQSKTLMVTAEANDVISVSDEFTITASRVGKGALHVIARSGDAILQITGKGWTNPLDRNDVNGSGDVSALDALRIINRLNETNGTSGQSIPLEDPATVTSFPLQFYDTSGDGQLSSLDALIVINELNRRSPGVAVANREPLRDEPPLLAIAETASRPVEQTDLSQMAIARTMSDLDDQARKREEAIRQVDEVDKATAIIAESRWLPAFASVRQYKKENSSDRQSSVDDAIDEFFGQDFRDDFGMEMDANNQ